MTIQNLEELEGLKRAGALVAGILATMRAQALAGTTPRDLDAAGAAMLRAAGARSAPVLTYGFPAATCISVNRVVAHGIPDGEALRELGVELGFPEYYGQNLDALDDCLADVDVPADGGVAIVLRGYDRFAQVERVCAADPRAPGEERARIHAVRTAAGHAGAERGSAARVRRGRGDAGDVESAGVVGREAGGVGSG